MDWSIDRVGMVLCSYSLMLCFNLLLLLLLLLCTTGQCYVYVCVTYIACVFTGNLPMLENNVNGRFFTPIPSCLYKTPIPSVVIFSSGWCFNAIFSLKWKEKKWAQNKDAYRVNWLCINMKMMWRNDMQISHPYMQQIYNLAFWRHGFLFQILV